MKLYLHVGHGKTGSSYLQSWLACNSQILEKKYKIRYPLVDAEIAKKGKFTHGNGQILESILQGESEISTFQGVANNLQSESTLLFSSENWMKTLPICQNKLNLLRHKFDIYDLKFMLFVRDPFEHAFSLYLQKVKSQGLCHSFAEWMPKYDVLSYLDRYLQSFEDCTTIINYSRAKDSIVKETIKWIGSDVDYSGWVLPPRKLVNRSLTSNELRMMMLVNANLSLKQSRIIGNKLIELRPNKKPASISIVEKERACFFSKHGKLIARLIRLPSESQLI